MSGSSTLNALLFGLIVLKNDAAILTIKIISVEGHCDLFVCVNA